MMDDGSFTWKLQGKCKSEANAIQPIKQLNMLGNHYGANHDMGPHMNSNSLEYASPPTGIRSREATEREGSGIEKTIR